MSNTKPQYGPAIRAARLARGWSQNRLAKAMSRKGRSVFGHHVSAWENGHVVPSRETLYRVGDALGFTTLPQRNGVEFVEPKGD